MDQRKQYIKHIYLMAIMLFGLFVLIEQHQIYSSHTNRDGFQQVTEKIEKGTTGRKISVTFLFIVLIGNEILHKRKILNNKYWKIDYAMFIIMVALSFIWSPWTILTLRKSSVYVMIFVSGVIVATRYSHDDIIKIFYFVSTALILLSVVHELFNIHSVESLKSYRILGTISSNYFGSICAINIMIIFHYNKSNTGSKYLLLFYLTIVIILLFYSKSRTAFWGMTITLGLSGMIFSRSKQIYLVIVIFVACILINLIFDYQGKYIIDTILMHRSGGNISSLTGRSYIWQFLYYKILERPILGYGFNSFWNVDNIEMLSRLQFWTITEGHSCYVEILLGLGIVGIVLYVVMFVKAFYLVMKYAKTVIAQEIIFYFTIILFCFINGFFESRVIQPSFLAFLFAISITKINCYANNVNLYLTFSVNRENLIVSNK